LAAWSSAHIQDMGLFEMMALSLILIKFFLAVWYELAEALMLSIPQTRREAVLGSFNE
jgi:hypothetical protein